MMKILNARDVKCSGCGRYLYTIREVLDEDSHRSRLDREHDFEDYVFVDSDESYYCDECYHKIFPHRWVG